jgi:hypothetical protein
MHIQGLSHDAINAGSKVGFNPDTFAAPGASVTYRIPLPSDPDAERGYYFHDHGASRQRVAHGLFGAIVLEPAGSTYLDPVTGQPLADTVGSNWSAIIQDPSGVSFREFVLLYHEIGDENFSEIRDAEGNTLPVFEELSNNYRPAARAINYRSEPFSNRLALEKDKSQGYGSYMFGDPATPIARSYLGEPTKTRLMHGGSEVFHVHHLHGGADRWRRNPNSDPNNDISGGLTKRPVQDVFSSHLDSQSIGPGTSYNLEHECGAGGCQQVAADFLYHCHIGSHYIAGMWGMWRVFDTGQPDLARMPTQPEPVAAVNSDQLVGLVVEGKALTPAAQITDLETQQSLEAFIEAQLPPQGVPFDSQDATVWDWVKEYDAEGRPIYRGEPETSAVWANYQSPNPGVRPVIAFNSSNGRYAWPLFRPHLGQRPPFSANGHTGAPWLGEDGSAQRPDGLCPDADVVPEVADNVTRQYPVTAITLPLQIEPDRFDEHGQLFVLGDEKDAILSGVKKREPLAIRSNVGDCVDILLTSELENVMDPDVENSTIEGQRSKVNIHSHFVQFDPQASDGVITGFSYEQSVKPHRNEGRFLTAPVRAGATVLPVTHVDRLRPGIFIGVGLGEGMCTPSGGGLKQMCTEVRRIASLNPTMNTITLESPLALSHDGGESVGVEFVRYRWYSDVDTGTVFFHDHVNFKSWDHGLFGAHIVEPEGSTYHDPTTGDEIRAGAIADIRAPSSASVGAGQRGSFREFMVFAHNRTNGMTGTIVDDPGSSFNLTAQPLAGRDPATRFSSAVHGDPFTPIPRAYVGDPIVFRHLAIVERVGGFRVTGHRFGLERFAEEAQSGDTSVIGISERLDLLTRAGGPQRKAGDYLYYSTLGKEFNAGAWGLVRVFDARQNELQRLPGHAFGTLQDRLFPVCPSIAPKRRYDVALTDAYIVTSDRPVRVVEGVAYMLRSGNELLAPNRDGSLEPAQRVFDLPVVREPLVLRVNEGECLEVSLKNFHASPASFTVGELRFDPDKGYGPPIGRNQDSTVAAGQTRKYQFFADKEEIGTTFAFNLANQSTLPKGAFAAVVVEPWGAKYLSPYTGDRILTGVAADIVTPRGSSREFVSVINDQDKIFGQSRMPYPAQIRGFASMNYSAKPWADRDGAANPSLVFDSETQGDPRHVFEAQVGDPVTFRVAAPWSEQLHAWNLEGHRWLWEPNFDHSEQVFSHLMTSGYSFDAPVVGGAGGRERGTGDYLVRDSSLAFLEHGLWNILSVVDPDAPNVRDLEMNSNHGSFWEQLWEWWWPFSQSSSTGDASLRGEPRATEAEIQAAVEALEDFQNVTVHLRGATVRGVVPGEPFRPGDHRGIINLPLRKALAGANNQRVWFVLTDASDQEFAEMTGVVWARTLNELDRAAVELTGNTFDPSSNEPWRFGSVPGLVNRFGPNFPADPTNILLVTNTNGGGNPYSPFKLIMWEGREVIINAPFYKWGDAAGQQLIVDEGGCDPRIRSNVSSRFFFGGGPPGCSDDPSDRNLPGEIHLGGQSLGIFFTPDEATCALEADTTQCARADHKLHMGVHRRDLFPYYMSFETSKPPQAHFHGELRVPKLMEVGTNQNDNGPDSGVPPTELFNTFAGGSKAVAHIMQFHNGVFGRAGGQHLFQPGLVSYWGPPANDYSPVWSISNMFFDCDLDGLLFRDEANVGRGAQLCADLTVPNFCDRGNDPNGPRIPDPNFDPHQMDDKAVECGDVARQITGNPDGFVYIDELGILKSKGLVEETATPSGWPGTGQEGDDGGPDASANPRSFILNCPSPVHVEFIENVPAGFPLD